MNIRIALGLVVAMGIAFAGGAEWNAWQGREALKAHPCSVTIWDPNAEHFTQATLDSRTCLKLGPSQQVAGTWVDDPYSARFTPEGATKLPTDVDLSVRGPLRAKIYSLAGVDPSQQFSGRTFHVSIIGRLSQRDCCHTDVRSSTIVVDDVLAARSEPSDSLTGKLE